MEPDPLHTIGVDSDDHRMSAEEENTGEKSVSAYEVAMRENLAMGLAKDLLEAVEMASPSSGMLIGSTRRIVRDEQAGGGAAGGGAVRWYRDLISEWTVDQIVASRI